MVFITSSSVKILSPDLSQTLKVYKTDQEILHASFEKESIVLGKLDGFLSYFDLSRIMLEIG